MMNETRNVLIGFELNNDTSQLCYYDRRTKEAVSVPPKVGSTLYTFPTVILKMNGKDEWHFGLEAEYFERKGEGISVHSLVEKAKNGTKVKIRDRSYTPEDLLSVFFREALKLLGLPDIVRSITGIAVTGAQMDGKLAYAVRSAFEKLGFQRDVCIPVSRSESFYYYGYSQTPDRWARGMALLAFRERSVQAFRLVEHRAGKPCTVTLEKIGDAALPAGSEKRDQAFLEVSRGWFRGTALSSIYITGDGFGSEWAKESTKFLGKAAAHVFEGQNLFVKGACLALAEKWERHALKDRIFDGPDIVRATVGIDVSDRGETGILTLVRAGENWYGVEKDCQLILMDRRDLLFTVIPMKRERHANVRMELPGLPERPAGAARISLHVRMKDAGHVLVRAEDMGFGELFPDSGQKWSREISLEEILK